MKNILFVLLFIFCNDTYAQIYFSNPIETKVDSLVYFNSEFKCVDIDNDSKLDVVLEGKIDSFMYILILLNDGSGNFSTIKRINLGNTFTYDNKFGCGDFNGDGKIDIASYNSYGYLSGSTTLDTLKVFLNTGSGNYIMASKYPFTKSQYLSGFLVGDFNGDTKIDLITTVNYSDKISLFLGDGSGNFVSPISTFIGNYITSCESSDLNNDGIDDIIASRSTNVYDTSISVLLGTPTGNFLMDTLFGISPSCGFSNTFSNLLTVADFNGDNIKDFALWAWNDAIGWYGTQVVFRDSLGINYKGNNIPSLLMGVNGSGNALGINNGDFNNDGNTDLLHYNRWGDSVFIMLGDGLGNFYLDSSNKFIFSHYGKISETGVGDFNGDGRLDLIAIGRVDSMGMPSSKNGIRVLLNSSQNNGFEFNPKSSGTCGYTSINFFGNNIQLKMHLKFTATGRPDIKVPDSNITYTGTNTFKANVDFSSATIGKYNVVLTDSNGIATTITDGFEVQATSPPKLEIKIVGPAQTRIGLPTRYYLKITNTGNCHALAVPIMLFVSGNNKVTFIDSIYDLDGNKRDTMLYAELENYFDKEGKSKGHLFLINQIPSTGTLFYPIEITALSPHEMCNIYSSIGYPLINSDMVLKRNRNSKVELNTPSKDCLDKLALGILSAAKSEVLSMIGDVSSCGIGIVEGINKYIIKNESTQTLDFGISMNGTMTSCIQAATTIFVPESRLLKYAFKASKKGMELYGGASSGLEIAAACSCIIDATCDANKIIFEGRSAKDPNDKFGIGFGDVHWINNTQELSYGIHFENVDTASAAAQTVRVVDTLDATRLDLSTFKLELLTIGNNTIDFSTRTNINQPIIYDMRPSIDLILKIETSLDTATGRFEIVYTSLDTTTFQPTTDPLLGFLPPNINRPEGEGAFYYSVKLKHGLPNNDVINNTAHIIFDANDTIPTPTWVNTIDILPPTSKMNSIVTNTNDTIIYLSWHGSDFQSGVQKYDLFYSENGGQFQSYVTNYANDSIQFHGKAGSSYSFYTIAIDNVGNREVKSSGEVSAKINEQDVQIFPNPSTGEFSVQTKNDVQVSSISLFDLQGQKIPITYKKVNNAFKVHAACQQYVGNYILKIITSDKTISRKITIER